MRPLPRLHAITDASVLALPDLGVRAAALASAGPAIALHARDREATGAALTAAARRLGALARPAEAALFVNARPDVAAAVAAHGLHLGARDLAPADARSTFRGGWLGASVHSLAEARAAIAEGVDYLMLGPVFGTPSHPGHPPAGPALLREVAALGRPVIAIGGVTADRVAELRRAGAWGVAAIRAFWHADDPALAARGMLSAWEEAA
jgi:thiamine-phosphate pyrophosphorylase